MLVLDSQSWVYFVLYMYSMVTRMMNAKGKHKTHRGTISDLADSQTRSDAQQVFGSTDERVDDGVMQGKHKGEGEQTSNWLLKINFVARSCKKLFFTFIVYHIIPFNWIGSLESRLFWLSSEILNCQVFIFCLCFCFSCCFCFFVFVLPFFLHFHEKALVDTLAEHLTTPSRPADRFFGNLNPREHTFTFTFNRLASSQWIDQRNEGVPCTWLLGCLFYRPIGIEVVW